ncbi:MAG TPA: trehalose-phosphatase, partial [Thalassobaculum sp.]
FRPAVERDKGGAVALLRRTVNGAGPAPAILYIGDDVTDEDAFRTLDRNRDVGVVVADPPRPSAADWCVPDTDAVGALLDRLVAARGGVTP